MQMSVARGSVSDDRVVDLDELVDGQRFGRPLALLVLIATLAMVSDGFDLSVMGYVAPELLKEWNLTPGAMVPVFSAGIIGMLVGGPLLGMLGDRYGRKKMIVAGLAAIGVTTLITLAADSITELALMRFLTGVGLGGVIPNVGALVAESTPKRIRGRVLVIVTIGVALGIALPGLVSATLVERFGWQALLLVGGALPIVIAALAHAAMPESIKFLAQRDGASAETLATARRMRPDLPLANGARVVSNMPQAGRGSIKPLFRGDFLLVTPLLWICQAANQMANFFSLTWLPTLLQAGGASTAQAGISASLFSLGGLVGGLALMFLIDRRGMVPVVVLFVVGAPLVAAMAVPDLPFAVHALIIGGAGLCVTGIQLALTALLGMVHPTAIRSAGTGWTQAAGRLGALGAPVVGGVLLAMDIPIGRLPLAPAALMVLGAAASLILAILCYRRFGGARVGEFSSAP